MAKGKVLGIPFLKKCSVFSANGMEIQLEVGHSGSYRVKRKGSGPKYQNLVGN